MGTITNAVSRNDKQMSLTPVRSWIRVMFNDDDSPYFAVAVFISFLLLIWLMLKFIVEFVGLR